MAHSALPPSHKPPGQAVPPASGSASNSQFTPRKEFIRDPRIVSEFALLALSGTAAVRLYSFPATVISALRRLFDHRNLITAFREDDPRKFFEFSLDRKPWANPRSCESEKLIVGILTVVLQCGYSFLSTIDYGREQDDRVAMAFSKPVSALSVPGSASNASAVTLHQPSRAPFALSFPSNTVLRVIDPPLHSTPAILQAVRGAWPRGVVNEKRVGESAWEFKLKGYKWFQEDTFATDSLHYILVLLRSLDNHAFTLLTSLSLANRSRGKDLWIFTGPSEEFVTPPSSNSSPATSSLELKREVTPQHLALGTAPGAPFRVGLGGNAYPSTDAQTHARSTSDTTPATSSPLKPNVAPVQKVQGAVLRKASPKMPLAFTAENETYGSYLANHRGSPPSSSVGSLDMTGIGSGRGRTDRQSQTPQVLYSTGYPATSLPMPRLDGPSLWQTLGSDSPPAADATPNSGSDNLVKPPPSGLEGAQLRPQEHAGDTFPRYDQAAGTPVQLPTFHAPSPTLAPTRDHILGNGHAYVPVRESSKRDRDIRWPDSPRTPTPPLLAPGVFRDSAFSSATGRTSFEIPIAWTGRDADTSDEKKRAVLAGIQEENEDGRRVEQERTQDRTRGQPSLARSAEAFPGPGFPGGWAPREERRRDDVANTLPPTIHEQPSQELAEGKQPARTMADKRSRDRPTSEPELGSERAKRNEVGSVNTSMDASVRGDQPTTPNGAPPRRASPTRRGSDTSGWVWVNIEGREGTRPGSGKGKERELVPNTTRGRVKSPDSTSSSSRPTTHTRSSSDSRLLRTPITGAATSSMSPAAKAIAIIDAVSAKEREQEKAQSGSGLRRIFARNKDKGSSDSAESQKRRAPGGAVESEDQKEKAGLKDKSSRKTGPAATKASQKRRSLD